MCDPVTLMIVMGTMQMMSKAQEIKASNKMARQEGVAAHKAASFDYQQLTAKRQETDEQAAQEKLQRQLQTKREHGRIAVATGEAGVGGSSPIKVMGNALMQGSYDVSVIEANRSSKARQIIAEKKAVHAKAEYRTNVAKAKTDSPTLGAMQISMAVLQGGMPGYMMGSWFQGSTMTADPNLPW